MDGSVAPQRVGEPCIGLAHGLHVGRIDHLQLVVAHHEAQLLAGPDVVGRIVVHDAVVVELGDGLQQCCAAAAPVERPAEQGHLLFALLAVEGIDLGKVLVHAVGDVLAYGFVELNIILESGFQSRVQPGFPHLKAFHAVGLSAKEQRRGDECNRQQHQGDDDEVFILS